MDSQVPATMSSSIEMNDLSGRAGTTALKTPGEQAEHHNMGSHDGSVATWAWVSAALLSLFSLPLLLFPRFMLFLASSSMAEGENRAEPLTYLEKFLAVHFGIFMVAVAVTLVLYIPSDAPIEQRPQQARGHPLLVPLTGASCLSSFISYNTRTVGSLSSFMWVVTAVIGAWGLWVTLFEGSSRISRKTGADKHTSAFLFGNTAAASSQKTQWKEQQSKR